jgi:pimeloyl-ACP methyl ester carboxylesterase
MTFDTIPLPHGIRARYVSNGNVELRLFSGRTIDVPAMFIAGKSDWGIYQRPGNLERMQTSACTDMHGCHLLDGAGHWVQQEQPQQVSALLTQFLRRQA